MQRDGDMRYDWDDDDDDDDRDHCRCLGYTYRVHVRGKDICCQCLGSPRLCCQMVRSQRLGRRYRRASELSRMFSDGPRSYDTFLLSGVFYLVYKYIHITYTHNTYTHNSLLAALTSRIVCRPTNSHVPPFLSILTRHTRRVAGWPSRPGWGHETLEPTWRSIGQSVWCWWVDGRTARQHSQGTGMGWMGDSGERTLWKFRDAGNHHRH